VATTDKTLTEEVSLAISEKVSKKSILACYVYLATNGALYMSIEPSTFYFNLKAHLHLMQCLPPVKGLNTKCHYLPKP